MYSITLKNHTCISLKAITKRTIIPSPRWKRKCMISSLQIEKIAMTGSLVLFCQRGDRKFRDNHIAIHLFIIFPFAHCLIRCRPFWLRVFILMLYNECVLHAAGVTEKNLVQVLQSSKFVHCKRNTYKYKSK